MIKFDNSLIIQLLDEDSINQIHAIEKRVHLTPWSIEKIQSCFYNERIKVFGCFYNSELTGYAILQIVEPEAELQNFAIAKNFQHKGIGDYFLCELIRICRLFALDKILLEVRESNSAAIVLYRANGFKKVGSRKDYYQTNSGKVSALLMTKTLRSVDRNL